MRRFFWVMFWFVFCAPMQAQTPDTLTAALDAALDADAKAMVWADAGRSFLDRRRFAEALSCFEQALALSKKKSEPRWWLWTAEAAMGSKDLQKAYFYNFKIINLPTSNVQPRYRWKAMLQTGFLFQRMGEWNSAAAWYRKALTLSRSQLKATERLVAMGALAEALLHLNQVQEAEELCLRGLAIKQQLHLEVQSGDELTLLGEMKLAAGKVKEAEEAFSAALQIKSAFPYASGKARAARGCSACALTLGKTQQAIAHLLQAEKATAQEPTRENRKAQAAWAWRVYSALGKQQAAKENLNRYHHLQQEYETDSVQGKLVRLHVLLSGKKNEIQSLKEIYIKNQDTFVRLKAKRHQKSLVLGVCAVALLGALVAWLRARKMRAT